MTRMPSNVRRPYAIVDLPPDPIRLDPDYGDVLDEIRDPMLWIAAIIAVLGLGALCVLVIAFVPGPT